MDSNTSINEQVNESLQFATNQAPHEYHSVPIQFKQRTKKVILSICFIILYLVAALLIDVALSGNGIDYIILLTPPIVAIPLGIFTGIKLAAFDSIGKSKWTVGADGIKIYNRKGEITHSYDIDAYVRSNVVKNYTNGVYSGTSRSIEVIDERGKKKILAWHYNSDDFTRAVNDIEEIKVYGSFLAKGNDVEKLESVENKELANDDTVNRIFEIDKKEVSKGLFYKGSKSLLGWGITLIGFGVLTLFADVNEDTWILTLLVFAAGLALLAVQIISVRNAKSKIPRMIKIESERIIVDENTHVASSLKTIVVTPASYQISKTACFWIKITANNVEKEYCLGINRAAGPRNSYKDYAELCSCLRLWCGIRGIEFMNDLM
ncbi:MAG: hypothetical protein MJ153_08685 [Clostridia bacterium]|nr:hypothetical protein [Clostridia bacterium]